MEEIQREDGDHTHTVIHSSLASAHHLGKFSNLHTVHYNESYLILHDWVSPAASHFGNSIKTSGKNGRVCNSDGYEKTFEASGIAENCCGFIELASEFSNAKEDVHGHEPEDYQSNDLRYETDHHNVVSCCWIISLGCCSRSATVALVLEGSLEDFDVRF